MQLNLPVLLHPSSINLANRTTTLHWPTTSLPLSLSAPHHQLLCSQRPRYFSVYEHPAVRHLPWVPWQRRSTAGNIKSVALLKRHDGLSYDNNSNAVCFPRSSTQVYGDVDNLLRPTSAVFNIGLDKLSAALSYFSKYPPTHTDILNAS